MKNLVEDKAFTTKPFSGFAASRFNTEVRGNYQGIHFLGKGDKND